MNNVVPLPGVPVPAPPNDPPCEWCGSRPTKPYEVVPAVEKIVNGARVVKKRATMAYACKFHRDRFDQRKAEAAAARAAERERKRTAKA
jgi:hypothetical protein